MKKTIYLVAAATLAMVSCNKEIFDNPAEVISSPATDIIFELTANHPDGADTKAVKTGWEPNDVIFVFFSNQAAPKYAEMKWDGSKWTTTAKNELSLAESETGTMRAIYLPFGSDATVSASGTSFRFSETYLSYYLTGTLAYTVTGGKITGEFNMQIPEGYVQFFWNDASADPSTKIELREPHLTPQGIASIAADGTITHTSMASGAPLPGYVYDKAVKETGESKGYLFSGILAAGARNASTNYNFTLVVGGWEGTYYYKDFSGKTWYRGESDGRALKMPTVSNWTAMTENKPIDLGIDVAGKRIYWSNCNLGATTETGYGDYYGWGEILNQDYKSADFSWSGYMLGDGTGTKFNKYTASSNANAVSGTADGLTRLEMADDAARVDLGRIYRIPTKDELQALVTNCTKTPQNDYKGTGVKGYLFTSNKTGYTSNSIFMPAAGCYNDNSGVLRWAGNAGYWWASTLYTNVSQAYRVFFSFSSSTAPLLNYYDRNYGYSVRPVSE